MRPTKRPRTDYRNSLRGLDLEVLRKKLAALSGVQTADLPGAVAAPPSFRKDVLDRRVALGENVGFRKDHADLIGKLRELRGQEGADPAVLAALKARRDAKLFGKSQGTFTPDAPDEPLRGTVSPDFSSPRVPKATAKTYKGRLKGMRTTSRKRGRRRDFGIGVSSR